MAPEVLRRNYGQEIDVWGAGVKLLHLLCGVPPFLGSTETEEGIAHAIVKGTIDFNRYPWARVSDEAKDLVEGMLDANPHNRFTVEEVLALITNPQEAYVFLTFASLLYHGNLKEGVKFSRRHSDAASIYAPEISNSQDSISDDELVERVTELAVLLQNSLDILTDKENLKEAMSRFPGSHVLVW
ncbi:hypothetical protein FXO38_24335, partial [Capsicum annuum]